MKESIKSRHKYFNICKLCEIAWFSTTKPQFCLYCGKDNEGDLIKTEEVAE